MEALNFRLYDPQKDEPRTGWDARSIKEALESGEQLHVDQNGDIWTIGQMEYVGKIRMERNVYTYKVIKEDFHTGERGKRARRIFKNYPLEVGKLYIHIPGLKGCWRVLELLEVKNVY